MADSAVGHMFFLVIRTVVWLQTCQTTSNAATLGDVTMNCARAPLVG